MSRVRGEMGLVSRKEPTPYGKGVLQKNLGVYGSSAVSELLTSHGEIRSLTEWK